MASMAWAETRSSSSSSSSSRIVTRCKRKCALKYRVDLGCLEQMPDGDDPDTDIHGTFDFKSLSLYRAKFTKDGDLRIVRKLDMMKESLPPFIIESHEPTILCRVSSTVYALAVLATIGAETESKTAHLGHVGDLYFDDFHDTLEIQVWGTTKDADQIDDIKVIPRDTERRRKKKT